MSARGGKSSRAGRRRLSRCVAALVGASACVLLSEGLADEMMLVPGDEVRVFIPGADPPESVYQIDSQGDIDLGINGRVKISGVPIEKGEELLKDHLSNYLRSTAGVTLMLVKAQRTLMVTGRVANPGLVTIDADSDLWGAVHSAGGLISGADLSRVSIIRHGLEIPVDLHGFLTRDVREPLPAVRAGDTIFVPADPSMPISEGGATAFLGNKALDRKVFVIGSVRAPGLFDRSRALDVLTAVSLAGGPDAEADLGHVRLLTSDTSRPVNLIDALRGKPLSANLLPGTGGAIVYVPSLARGLDNRLGKHINVIGGVRDPGRVPISGPIEISDAISLAGGPVNGAKLKKVHVVQVEPGYTLVQRYNLERFFEEGGMLGHTLIPPGSTIVVGQRDLTVLNTTLSVISTAAMLSTSAALWLGATGVLAR